MRSPAEFKRDIAEKITRRVLIRLEDITPSRRLRATLRRLPGSTLLGDGQEVRITLEYPEYWAVWLHDGHGPINAQVGRKLVFYDNPNDDPRIRPIPGGYPTRASSARRLTAAEFQEGLRQNRLRAAQGRDPFMWVVDSVGPFVGYKWLEGGGTFNEGMRGFLGTLQPELERDFRRWLLTDIVENERSTARVRLS